MLGKKAFSFAYLRRDIKFPRMVTGYNAGFILYPHLKTPPHKSKQRVLCSYPVNGASAFREDRGCGRPLPEFDETGSGSGAPCHIQNITTASQWLENYNSSEYMCGFKMMKETAAKDFATCLQAQALLIANRPRKYVYINNELRVESWDEYNVKSLPIEAFFYFVGFKNGYEAAIKYRDEFYDHSGGENLPIVGIKLPSHDDENIQITS